MADIAIHRLHAISVSASVWSSVVADSVKMSNSAKRLVEHNGGKINVSVGAIASAAPVVEFDVREVDKLTAPTASTALILVFLASDDAGLVGSGYISMTAKAVLYPIRLSCRKGGAAALTVRAHLLSTDGSTNPVTLGTTSATLAVVDTLYGLGATEVGGSAVTGIQSQDIAWNYKVESNEGATGFLYPTFAYCTEQAPVVKISTTTMAEATAARVAGGGQALAASACTLKFNTLQGTPATKTFAIAKGLATAEVNGGIPSTVDIEIHGLDADTTDTTFVVAG